MAVHAAIPVPIKNADRVVYPVAGFTKRDVVEYYVRIAPWLLPHLHDRPVTLKRYPDHVHGEFFYEKDAPAFTPSWVKTFPVWRRSGESQIHYIMIQDARTLAWAASVGTVEIHPFLAKAPHFDSPTEVVFDLDPGDQADVLTCAEVAFLLRDLLQRLGLSSLVKVSGSKGLQVYVPLNTRNTYSATQPFARTVAEMLASEHPRLILAEMARAQRKGRVFIDWSQNADFKTTVGVYSLRAKRRHPYVSMPVGWDELRTAMEQRSPESLYFQADEAIERVSKIGDLFAPVLNLKQELPEAFRLPVPSRESRVPSRSSRAAESKQQRFGASPAARNLPPHASAQGGRRRFAVFEKGDRRVLVVELHDTLRAWSLPKQLPTKPGVPVQVSLAKSSRESAERILGDAEWDGGTVELIEGNYSRGYLDLYFSGEKLRGEWELVEDSTKRGWQMIRPAAGRSYAPEEFLRAKRSRAGENSGLARISARSGQTRSSATKFVAPSHSGRPRDDQSAKVQLPHDIGPLPHGSPRFTTPMECRLVESVPDGPGWLHELKLDGYRSIAVKDGRRAHLYSRHGNSYTKQFPAIAEALQASSLEDCVLDGEIVALDDQGRPSFQQLQNIRTTDRPIVYYVFDLLNYSGCDLLRLPLLRRKRALDAISRGFRDPVRLAATVDHGPELLVEEVRRLGLEGVVAKRAESVYEVGKRSGAWVKYRVAEREEFIIGGYLPGRNYLDAILVGKFDGKKLLFVKKVRNGFVPETRKEVFNVIRGLTLRDCPFANLPEPSDRRGAVDVAEMKKCAWVRPQISCEVEFAEWTAGGRLRHAAFRQLTSGSSATPGQRVNRRASPKQ